MPTIELMRERKEDDEVGDSEPLNSEEFKQYVALTLVAIRDFGSTSGTDYPDEYAEAIVAEHGRATPILIADDRRLGVALRNVAFSTRPAGTAATRMTDSEAIESIMAAKDVSEKSAAKAYEDLTKMDDERLNKVLRNLLAQVNSASKDAIAKLTLLVPVLRMLSLRRGAVGGFSPTELRTLARYSHVRVKSKTPVPKPVPLKDAFAEFDTTNIRAQTRNSPEWIAAARQAVVDWVNGPKAINPKISRKRMNQLIAFEKDPVTHTLYLLGEATEAQLKSIGSNLNYGAHGRTHEFVRLNRYKLMGDTSGIVETHKYLQTYFAALQQMYNAVLKGFMKGAEIGAAKSVPGFKEGVPLVMKVVREDESIIENGKTVHYATYRLKPGQTEHASCTYSYHGRVGDHGFLKRLTDTPLPKGPVEKHELSKMIVGCQRALYTNFYGSTPQGVAVRLNKLIPFLDESAQIMKKHLHVYFRGRVYKKNVGGNLTSPLLAREFVTNHGFYRHNPLLDNLPDHPNQWEKYYLDNNMYFYITKENAEVGLPFPSGVKGRECRAQLVEYVEMVYTAAQKSAAHLQMVAPGWDTNKIKRKVGPYERVVPVKDGDISDLNTLIEHAQSDTAEAPIRVITIPPVAQLASAWYHKGINHDAHQLGKLQPPMETRISCFSHYNFNGGGAHAFLVRLLDLNAKYRDDHPTQVDTSLVPQEETQEYAKEEFAAAVYSDNMNCRMPVQWMVDVDPNVVVVCNTVGAKPGIEKSLTSAAREKTTYTFREQDCEGNFAFLSLDGSKAETAFTRQVCENLHMAMLNHCGSTPAFRKYTKMVGISGHSGGVGVFGQHSRDMNQNLSGSQSTSVNNSFVSYCTAEFMRHYIKVNTSKEGVPLKGIHDLIAEVRTKVGVRLTLERVVIAPRNGALGVPGDTIPFDLLGNSVFISGDGKYHLQLEDVRLYRSVMTEKVVFDPDNKKSSLRAVVAAKLGKLISLMLMSCLGNNYRLELFRNEAIHLAGDDEKQAIDYTETDEETEWSFSVDALNYARARNLNPVTMEMGDIEDFHYGYAVHPEDHAKRVSPFAGSEGKGGAGKWAAAVHSEHFKKLDSDAKPLIATLKEQLVAHQATDPRDPLRLANIARVQKQLLDIVPWLDQKTYIVALNEDWSKTDEGITRMLGQLDDEAFQAGLQRELRFLGIKVEYKTRKKGGYFITPDTITEVLRKLGMPKSLYTRTTIALYSYISAHPDIMIAATNPELADRIIAGIDARKEVHEARAVKAQEKAEAKSRATETAAGDAQKAAGRALADQEAVEKKGRSFPLNNSGAVVERQDLPPPALPKTYAKEFLEWIYTKLNKMEYNVQSGKSSETGEVLKAYIAKAHPKSRLAMGNYEYNMIISEVSLDSANISPLPEPTKADANTHLSFLKTVWQRYAMKHTVSAIKKAGKSTTTWYALEKRQGYYMPPTRALLKDVVET